MTTDVITAADGCFRVRLERDAYPEPPEDEGAPPAFRVDLRTGRVVCRATHGMRRPTHADRIAEAIARWGVRASPRDAQGTYLARYLSIFHGTQEIEMADNCDGQLYVFIDTAEWRTYIGVSPDHDGPLVAGWATEYQSYLDGEVYGYVVERAVTWTTSTPGYSDRQRTTWEEVESCWGYYGLDYAREAARETLDDIAEADRAQAAASAGAAFANVLEPLPAPVEPVGHRLGGN